MFEKPQINDILADIRRFTVKPVGDEDKVELVIHLPLNQVDVTILSRLRRNPARLTLVGAQAPLPMKSDSEGGEIPVADGQLSLDDINGTLPDGPAPARYSLLLTEVPTDEKAMADVEKLLKKLTGMKVAEVRDNLTSLPWALVINGKDHFAELDAVADKMALEDLGAFVSLVPWKDEQAEAELGWPEVAALEVSIGHQYQWHTGTTLRVYDFDGETVTAHGTFGHYAPVSLAVFQANATALPEDQWEPNLNDERLFQVKDRDPDTLKTREELADPTPIGAVPADEEPQAA